MITLTEENYLKAIYHLSNNGTNTVNTNAIAQVMATKASSVTDMIKKLTEKKYTSYKKYQGVNLTKQGTTVAVNIIRKHRLWEVFLVEHLNFSWDEVHDVAEQLEHVKSEKLTEELDAFLNYPTRDPHGDPIPQKNGYITASTKIRLSEAVPNNSYMCIRVIDTTKTFLNYLDHKGIKPGCHIKILHKEPYDNSLIVSINDNEIVLSYDAAKNLYVKIL